MIEVQKTKEEDLHLLFSLFFSLLAKRDEMLLLRWRHVRAVACEVPWLVAAVARSLRTLLRRRLRAVARQVSRLVAVVADGAAHALLNRVQVDDRASDAAVGAVARNVSRHVALVADLRAHQRRAVTHHRTVAGNVAFVVAVVTLRRTLRLRTLARKVSENSTVAAGHLSW